MSSSPPSRHMVLSPRAVTEVYTVSYLVFFALLGTLARLGLQALTTYPGLPVIFTSVWPNFGGSLIIGFLAEDRVLFHRPRSSTASRPGPDTLDVGVEPQDPPSPGAPTSSASSRDAELAAKKTIPLYIGLSTGFCGSFTSFSSLIRDAVLAATNDLGPLADYMDPDVLHRNGGQSFMALVAVLMTTISLSLSGLFAGAHLAAALQPVLPSGLAHGIVRSALDMSAVVVGWGCWVAAILLCALGPYDAWRGQVLFSLVFAPLGCIARFYISLSLNGRVKSSFPMGTFAVNVAGTMILAMCWDIAHAQIGGVIGCQVLQGIEDGFCGCLTTVSTWVAELAALESRRRRDAYFYGTMSVATALIASIAIIGGYRWSGDGLPQLQCIH